MAEFAPRGSRGFKRLNQIIAPHGRFPFGKSYWYERVATGEFPQPIKLGPRLSMWSDEDLDALADRLIAEGKMPAEDATSANHQIVEAVTDSGTVTINPDNSLTFFPESDASGSAVISVKFGNGDNRVAA